MATKPRDATLKGIWAQDAATVIPATPNPGTAYRNAAVVEADFESGQAYDRVYDSARMNELYYELSALAKEAEQYGVMRWSPLTDYPAEGVAAFSGILWKAKQPSGPNTPAGPVEPSAAGGAYWAEVTVATLSNKRAMITNLNGDGQWASFDGSEDARLGVYGALPVLNGGTAASTIPDALRNFFPARVPSPDYVSTFDDAFKNSGHCSLPELRQAMGLGTCDLTQSMTWPGWTRLSNGLIFQWGGLLSAHQSATYAYFPIAFPTRCLQVLATGGQQTEGVQAYVTANTWTASRAVFSCFYNVSGSAPVYAGYGNVMVYWFAIGY